ncbi:MAG: hypothetical protein ABSG45_09155 [Nitrososphaerales archaeon]
MKIAGAVVWLSGSTESTVVVAEQSAQHDFFDAFASLLAGGDR